MAATIVAAAIAAGVGIYGAIHGAHEKKKAAQLAAQNQRPTYQIPTYELDNQRLAESQASQGMSDAAKDQANRGYDRGLTSSINGILQGGGNPNDISNAYNVYNNNVGQLALADDAVRRQNLSRLMAQNDQMANYQDKGWDINQYAPYADTAAKAQALYAQGDKDFNSGLSTTASSIGQGIGAYSRLNALNKVNGGTGTSSVDGAVGNNFMRYGSGYNNSNPLSQTYINNNSASQSIYDTNTDSYIRSMDWTRVKPQNRQGMWALLNSRYGSNNQNDLLLTNPTPAN